MRDKTQLDITKLNDRLAEISKHKTITHIDMYGGEISLLNEQYVLDTISVIRKYYTGPISVITNLSATPKWFFRDDIDVSVSFDYTAREKHDVVLRNMVEFNKPFHVLTLVSAQLIRWTDEELLEMIHICNSLPKLTSVELKPYSANQANHDDITFKDYERFVRRWIELSPVESRGYEFVTENNINRVLDGNGYSWSDDHIYITPQGEFAVLEFDRNGDEYFLEMCDWSDYLTWVMDEYITVNTNVYCGYCEFRGKCLSEHLRSVENFETESCSGSRGLVEWYRTTK